MSQKNITVKFQDIFFLSIDPCPFKDDYWVMPLKYKLYITLDLLPKLLLALDWFLRRHLKTVMTDFA